MRVTHNKQAFVAKLERRGYKRVGIQTTSTEELKPTFEIYARPESGRQYWVFDVLAQCVIIEESRVKRSKLYFFCTEPDLTDLSDDQSNPKKRINTAITLKAEVEHGK